MWWLSILILIPITLGLIIRRIKKVPHGYVQFQTGVALRLIPNFDEIPPVKVRQQLEKMVSAKNVYIRKILPVADIRHFTIPTRHGDVPARLYNHNSDPGLPVIVFMHGGGFCAGSFNVYEEVARRMCRETRYKVLIFEYSLSPEYKYPRAHQECYDVAQWVSENSNFLEVINKQIILFGDSAGGNLVLSTFFEFRKLNQSALINSIVAVYPVIGGNKDVQSYRDYKDGYILTGKSMDVFTEVFIRSEQDIEDPMLALDLQKDLSQFPPLLLITAEFDPLRDAAELFADRIRSTGGHVTVKRYAGTVHAFFGIRSMGSRGPRAVKEMSQWLQGFAISKVENVKATSNV